MRFSYLLLLFSITIASQAQNCLAYEKELEEYFISYQSGDNIDFKYLERTRWKCDNPTPKLDLIYYYFKAVSTLGNQRFPSQEAYEVATRHYDNCATNFPYLLKNRSNSRFTDVFFDRAENLESRLALIANQLNYYPEDRKYGQRTDGSWIKRGMGNIDDSQSTRRVSSANDADFVKKFYHKGKYVNNKPNAIFTGPTRGNNGEFYGYVGDLSELNTASYFRYIKQRDRERGFIENDRVEMLTRGERPSAQSFPEQARVPKPSLFASDWVNELSGSGALQPMLSMHDNRSIKTKPGKGGEELDIMKFGEEVARLADDTPIIQDGESYIQVRNRQGVTGWVKEMDMVNDGKLAVFTGHTSGYLSLNSRLGRNGVIFKKGEMILLEAVRGDWIKIVSRNGEKKGWIYGIESLSIDPSDIQIADLVYNAYQDPSSYGRLVKLESIKNLPGFETAELALFVLDKIIETEQRGGFSFK